MHEIGLRILARRVQLIGAQYDRALVPVISYSTDHYFRIFFANRKGKNEVDKIMKQLSTLDGAGPMWLGPLWDAQMVKNMTVMAKKRGYMDILSLLEIIEQESRVQAAGFYDIHEVCSQLKTSIPRKDQLIAAIKKAGYDASNTHFKGEGIRSTIPKEKLIEILKKSENLKT